MIDTSLEALLHNAKDRHFHLRALDITISEMEARLVSMDSSPDLDRERGQEGQGQGQKQHIPQRQRLIELQYRLAEALLHRQAMVLDLTLVEAEVELLLLRRFMRGVEETDLALLPRCAGCFVDPAVFNRDTNSSRSLDQTRPAWPLRRDSLMPLDRELMPFPLRVAGKITNRSDMAKLMMRMGPERETKINDGPRRQLSLKVLVRKLKPARSSSSPLSSLTSDG